MLGLVDCAAAKGEMPVDGSLWLALMNLVSPELLKGIMAIGVMRMSGIRRVASAHALLTVDPLKCQCIHPALTMVHWLTTYVVLSVTSAYGRTEEREPFASMIFSKATNLLSNANSCDRNLSGPSTKDTPTRLVSFSRRVTGA